MRSILRRKFTLSLLAFLLLVLPLSTSYVSAKGLGKERREHPRLSRAIKDLQDAVDYMQKAPHDFGGHRAEAVEASQRAIEQLKRALEFDKNHE
jgi:hypothetical protein